MNTINLSTCYLGYFIAYAAVTLYKSAALLGKVGTPYIPIIFNGYAVTIVTLSILVFFFVQPIYLKWVEEY